MRLLFLDQDLYLVVVVFDWCNNGPWILPPEMVTETMLSYTGFFVVQRMGGNFDM